MKVEQVGHGERQRDEHLDPEVPLAPVQNRLGVEQHATADRHDDGTQELPGKQTLLNLGNGHLAMGDTQQPEVHHEDQTQEEAHAEDVKREERAEKTRGLFTKELAARERRNPLEESSKWWRPHQRSDSRCAALFGPYFRTANAAVRTILVVAVRTGLCELVAEIVHRIYLPSLRCVVDFHSGRTKRSSVLDEISLAERHGFAVGTDPPGKKDQRGDFCERDARIFDTFPSLILAERGAVWMGRV